MTIQELHRSTSYTLKYPRRLQRPSKTLKQLLKILLACEYIIFAMIIIVVNIVMRLLELYSATAVLHLSYMLYIYRAKIVLTNGKSELLLK